MDERGRINIVSKIDVIVAIFILIIGILVIIVGAGYLSMIMEQSSYSYASTPLWAWATPWFIIMLGITTIIYGIKRFIDDILKANTSTRQRNIQPPVRYQPPQRPPDQY